MLRAFFVAVLLALPAVAVAGEPGAPHDPRGPWWDACGPDIRKFGCGDKKTKEAVKACLEAHSSELSPRCKAFAAKT